MADYGRCPNPPYGFGFIPGYLALTLPVVEYEEIPTHWYKILYRVQFCFVIGLSAVLVANITILYGTVRARIANITPSDDI
ncbi:MAG: hypothetical protein HKN36_00720 [Hellea sp.]|nr:hypothetical protein [Hellea sp.]